MINYLVFDHITHSVVVANIGFNKTRLDMFAVATRIAESAFAFVLERLGVNARAVVETRHGHAGRLNEL